VAATATDAVLTWADPTTQVDGTTLDDLDHINIFRDGSVVATVSPGTETFTDIPPLGFTYSYTITAEDNEAPSNESAPSNTIATFVGTNPSYLVWVGPDIPEGSVSEASGDSLFNALAANGESCFLTNDLFEFGTDLSIYDGIFVVLGVYSNNHILGSGDPEGAALETYLQNGGKIYVEGADCFNYDPETGGYQIRPWFDLNDGNDGSADVAGVLGLNDLSVFTFTYNGDNNYMDELQPISSVPIWQNDANSDISGVFNESFNGGSGTAIGVVPSFGGFVSSETAMNTHKRLSPAYTEPNIFSDAIKPMRVIQQRTKPFVKKAAWYPELKVKRKSWSEIIVDVGGHLMIEANNQNDLMTAYLGLFGDVNSPALLDSAYAYDDTTFDYGIDDDDYVIMSFDQETNRPLIDASNINTVLSLNNGHSWLSGDGSLGTVSWINGQPAGDTLIVYLSTSGGLPTIAVGDTVTTGGVTITSTTGLADVSSFAISGSFDPVAMEEDSVTVTAGDPPPTSVGNTNITLDFSSTTGGEVFVEMFNYTPVNVDSNTVSKMWDIQSTMTNGSFILDLRIDYTDTDISGLDESLLTMAYFDIIDSVWYALDSVEVDIAGNYITAFDLDHFTLFAIGENTVFTEAVVLTNLTVFFQGPYSGGTMNTYLQQNTLLPLTQPYNGEPWNYAGTETVGSVPTEVVDWILVELRTGTDASTMVSRRACFVLSEGSVVDTDGISPLSFEDISDGDYYVVLYSRNHLAIMSALPVTLSSSETAVFDFTTDSGNYYGGVSVACEIETDVWGMWSGDINHDGEITTSDYTLWYNSARLGESGYLETDINYDSQVTTSDYTIWYNNARVGASSGVPEGTTVIAKNIKKKKVIPSDNTKMNKTKTTSKDKSIKKLKVNKSNKFEKSLP